MSLQNFIIGKIGITVLLLVGFNQFINSQILSQQFYFENDSLNSGFTLARLSAVSDSYVFIEFRSSDSNNRAFFACSYTFRNDSLLIMELNETIELERHVDIGPFNSKVGLDSLYLLFEIEQLYKSKLLYESVCFEINGNFYNRSKGCLTEYCVIVPKPSDYEFEVKIWSGKELLETFPIGIYNSRNIVSMRKLLFSSSKVFQPMSFFQSKFPSQIEYQGKEYLLNVTLQNKEFHDAKLAVEK